MSAIDSLVKRGDYKGYPATTMLDAEVFYAWAHIICKDKVVAGYRINFVDDDHESYGLMVEHTDDKVNYSRYFEHNECVDMNDDDFTRELVPIVLDNIIDFKNYVQTNISTVLDYFRKLEGIGLSKDISFGEHSINVSPTKIGAYLYTTLYDSEGNVVGGVLSIDNDVVITFAKSGKDKVVGNILRTIAGLDKV